MHAWLCENPIGVDALTWKELPTPAPKAGEVLIEIKAASLNFPDLLIVQNKYQMKPPLPFVPGSEYAGVVAGRGRRRHAPEGRPERRLPVGHRRLRHPHPRAGRAVHAAAARLLARGCGRLHHDLRHLAPCAGGPGAAQGRRDRAGAGRRRRRRHRGDPDRQGDGRQGDCRRLHRRKVRAVQDPRGRRHHQLHARKTCATRSRR